MRSKTKPTIFLRIELYLAHQLRIGLTVILCGWVAIGVISLAVCVLSLFFTDTLADFPRDNVSSIAGTLIMFLGVTTAILIAAFTTAHVQARTKQSSGYGEFLESVGSFKAVVFELETALGVVVSRRTRKGMVKWAIAKKKFIAALDNITPLWQGYEGGSQVEQHSEDYVKASLLPLFLMDKKRNQRWSEELRMRHELSLRKITVGLRLLDEAAVDRRFAESLVRILASLSLLLICCILVRMISGVGYGQEGDVATWMNLFVYLYLPILAIGNFLALLVVVFAWWLRLRRSDEPWGS